MAPLVFNAGRVQELKRFNLTFGRSREDMRWVDRKQLSFVELANLLGSAPIGAKNGECFVPALFSQNLRRMEQATQIDVAVLDSDCGHSLEYIREKIAAKGWRAIIHSTHSHLTDQTIIAATPAEKWLRENPKLTIGQYMVAKKGFLPSIMGIARIVDEIPETKNIIISHAPCPKFRVILPLNKSWLAEEYDSQDLANAKWRERIGALSYALGLSTDQSCVDTSRLFYLPRVRDEAALRDFACEVLQGEDCDLWSLPDAELNSNPNSALGLFDFQQPRKSGEVVSLTPRGVVGRVAVDKKTFVSLDGEVFDLSLWAANYANKFEIFDAIRAKAPGMLSARRSGVKHHIYCPNSGNHVTGGVEGSGTYVVNASQLAAANLPSISSGFVVHCMHSGCASTDRLDHVKAMLEAGNLTIADLTDPQFLQGDSAKINVEKIIKNLENKAIAEKTEKIQKEENETPKNVIKLAQSPSARERDSGNIAPYLYQDLPAALGAIHRYMCATAPKPQPVFALGGALIMCAAAIGQRVKMQYFNTRPNIYILNVGVSGSGKERPLSAFKSIARAAGLQKELVGAEEIASDTGIFGHVERAPRQAMLIDEASYLLNAVGDPRAGQHIKNVVGTLLKLYSSSHTTYASKSYADAERIKIIDQPCMSFLGTTTPNGLVDSLNSKDIESGLLSRMLVFDAGEHDPRISLPGNDPVPPEVIQWLTAWNAVQPVPNPLARIGGDAVIAPRTVMMTEEAKQIAMDFEGVMHDMKQKARSRGKDALYVRAFENALKFALIRACASVWPVQNEAGDGIVIDESALKVDAQTMRWAVDLSRSCVERMDTVTNDISDSAYEQGLRAIRRLVKKGGSKGVTMRQLARSPAGRVPSRTLNEMLGTLHDADEVRLIKFEKSGKGRPREVLLHKDYFTKMEITGLEPEDDDEEMEDNALEAEEKIS